jgi:hypothetical protein
MGLRDVQARQRDVFARSDGHYCWQSHCQELFALPIAA